MVDVWREDLRKVNAKAADSLADPAEYANLFQDYDLSLVAEMLQSAKYKADLPAKTYMEQKDRLGANLIDEARESGVSPPEMLPEVIPEADGADDTQDEGRLQVERKRKEEEVKAAREQADKVLISSQIR